MHLTTLHLNQAPRSGAVGVGVKGQGQLFNGGAAGSARSRNDRPAPGAPDTHGAVMPRTDPAVVREKES